MDSSKNARKTTLEASRSYYAQLGYYEELTRPESVTKRELDFLEYAFLTHATHKVRDVLDVACGSGRHVLGLAHRGYQCVGQDYTPEQIQTAKARAKHDGLSIKLSQGDATKLKYRNKFDAALALYILFLLPDDDSIQTCLRQIHRALKPGGILVCNTANPYYNGESWFTLKSIHKGYYYNEDHAPNMRFISIDKVKKFDPLHGTAWWQETHIIQTPKTTKIYTEHEHYRLLTYWDTLHHLQTAGFKNNKCHPDWNTKPTKKPKTEWLAFVSQKTTNPTQTPTNPEKTRNPHQPRKQPKSTA